VVGAFAHLAWFHDVVRMLYYLTGLTTERSALLAYHRLQDGVRELGETALAETVITPIRRQEPGHYAYYQMSARALWAQLAGWQRWLVRRFRAISIAPVGASTREQKADVGDMMRALGLGTPEEAGAFTEQISPGSRPSCSGRTSRGSRCRRTSCARSPRPSTCPTRGGVPQIDKGSHKPSLSQECARAGIVRAAIAYGRGDAALHGHRGVHPELHGVMGRPQFSDERIRARKRRR